MAIASGAYAQRSVADVTDDLRRVPILPVDRSHAPIIVLKGGTLLAETGGLPIANSVVVTQGNRIVAAGQAASTPIPANAARIVDISGLTIMPGLIDGHIHFDQQRGPDMNLYADSDAARAIRGTALARQLVEAGITAARDLGTEDDVALRLKEAVARHIIPGPRVLWSGQLIAITGGHTDEIVGTGSGHPRSGVNDFTRVADGPVEWRKAVREQIRKEADWIKISAPATQEEFAAAVDEAHMQGLRVAVDSFGKYTDWAIEAGVDSLEHPLDMSDQAVPLMVKHHTAFMPTLVAFRNLLATGYPSAGIPAGGFYYTFSRRFVIDHQQHLKRVAEAYKAGVPIGVGTDIPVENEVLYPGAYFEERGYLSDAGLPNSAVLASATRVGANIIGMGDLLGTIQPGKIADLLVIKGDPTVDLKALHAVRYVMADGRFVVENPEH